MKVDVDTEILTLDGQAFSPPVTIKDVCMGASIGQHQQDFQMPLAERRRLYSIGKRVFDGGLVELSKDDLTLLAVRIGMIYPTMLMGRALEILESESAPNTVIDPPK